MSLTLGEKLRQAREDRGLTIGDIAEQTRISALYLESIENDDYRILPGGIFNKGFVKSYAKFVGINEAEALSDYASLVSQSAKDEDEDSLKVYRPEVLTDDRSGSSMIPTIILATVILGAMTAGILFLVNYMRQPAEAPVAENNSNRNANASTEPEATSTPQKTDAPDMASLKIEFKAISEPVALTATSDGKTSSNVVTPGSVASFEPKESIKLSYSKSLANVVQLSINGKSISLPAQPLVPRRNAIEFEINKDNLAQIWTSGAISSEVPSATPLVTETSEVPANVAVSPTPAVVATPVRPTTTPKSPVPTNTNSTTRTNTVPRPTPARTASTPAPRPPAANNQP